MKLKSFIGQHRTPETHGKKGKKPSESTRESDHKEHLSTRRAHELDDSSEEEVSDPQNDTEDELSDDVDLDLTALDPKELKRVLAAEVITWSFFLCS